MRPGFLNIPGTLTLLAVAALWEISVRSGATQYEISACAVRGHRWFRRDCPIRRVAGQHGAHPAVGLIGWALSCTIGGALDCLLGLSALSRRYLLASLEVLRPLPAIAFLPVALLL